MLSCHRPPRPQVAALSNAAGVGGGAIFVPLFNVLLSFSIKNVSSAFITVYAPCFGFFYLCPLAPMRRGWRPLFYSATERPCANPRGPNAACCPPPPFQATALSQSVITGGALGAVAYSISRRHPRDASRTLVDFDLALVICPGLLLGVSTGVLLNIALPTW